MLGFSDKAFLDTNVFSIIFYVQRKFFFTPVAHISFGATWHPVVTAHSLYWSPTHLRAAVDLPLHMPPGLPNSLSKWGCCSPHSRFMNWKLIKTKLKHLDFWSNYKTLISRYGIWHNLKLTYHTPATWGDTSIMASRDESRSIERELRRLWSADIVFSAFQVSIWSKPH